MATLSSDHGFSMSSLERKLRELNSTLQSIQGTAQWLIHHRKNVKTIVSLWYKEIRKVEANKKLTLLYLANDVIQNGKKKCPEFKSEFSRVLPKALQHISQEKDDSFRKSVERVISVWEERKVFEPDTIVRFKSMLVSGTLRPQRRTRSESDVKQSRPDAKRAKLDKRRNSEEVPPNDKTPPEPEELIQRMAAIDPEKSAAHDMSTRQKIASFPPEIHDSSLLAKIKDKAAAETLSQKVEDASKLLEDYNGRLEAELKERGEVQELLDAFIWQQKVLLRNAKKNLLEYQVKMERVTAVKEELKSHLANLPDFTQLPASSGRAGSLAPLPTVGDLFN